MQLKKAIFLKIFYSPDKFNDYIAVACGWFAAAYEHFAFKFSAHLVHELRSLQQPFSIFADDLFSVAVSTNLEWIPPHTRPHDVDDISMILLGLYDRASIIFADADRSRWRLDVNEVPMLQQAVSHDLRLCPVYHVAYDRGGLDHYAIAHHDAGRKILG